MEESETLNDFQDDRYCFACGPDNPIGMKLKVNRSEKGRASFVWTPCREYQGWSGVLHGGIITTLLDEAMAYATGSITKGAATAGIEVSFRKPINTEEEISVSASLEKERGRLILMSAVLFQGGEEKAMAKAKFVVPTRQR